MRLTAMALVGVFLACDPADPPAAVHEPAPAAVRPDPFADLRDELIRMGLLDQTIRVGFSVEAAADTGFLRATLGLDSILTGGLRRIVDEYGWPTRSMVGQAAAGSAFLIVQHSPVDAFQREMLPRLESAAAADEAAASDVALLTDRLRTRDAKPQIFGTQFHIVDGVLEPYPIEDLANLDVRRARAGLTPMSEYVGLLRQTFEGPVRWPPDSAAQPPT